MQRWKRSLRLATAVVAVVVMVAGEAIAFATPTPAPASGSPGQGLEISPPVIELQADPGQTVTTEIRVRNVTKGELIAKSKVDDFGAGTDETGQPQLLLGETGASRYSLKFWIGQVPDIDLAPSELKKTQVVITVPRNAEPGGHFGVVRFTAVPPSLQGTGVALSASVGALVLLKVSGPISDQLSVEEFSSGSKQMSDWWGNGKTMPYATRRWFEYGPIDFLVRLRNTGSVHEKPVGTITVTNAFGKSVGSLNLNPNSGNVLPDSIRRFERTLNTKQLFGAYTATLTLTYGSGQKLTAHTSFWVVPWKLIVLVLIGLVAVFFILRLVIRRYNNYIIAQSRRKP